MALLGAVWCVVLFSSSVYSQTFFSDSERSGYYVSGLAFATAPSVLAQAGTTGDKLPTTTKALVDRNALRVSWTSNQGGDWSALALAPGFRPQNLTQLDSLGFWVYSVEGLAVADMPDLFFEVAPGNSKSARYTLSDFTNGDLPAETWTLVSLPLVSVRADAANASLNFTQVKAVIFGQAAADGQPHELYVDQIEAYSARGTAVGEGLQAVSVKAYPAHRELRFEQPSARPLFYSFSDGGQLKRLISSGTDTSFLDFSGGREAMDYTVSTYTPGFGFDESRQLSLAAPALTDATDEALLDLTQEYTLRYFWDFAHPTSFLSRERSASTRVVTIGGSGFGLMAWIAGIERGLLTRDEVVERLGVTLPFLEQADRFHGVWPHWMDGATGETVPFSPRDNGGDIVETAFMAQALLTLRQYFDAATPAEDNIRAQCTRMWEDIEWDWYQRPGQDAITWHWSPDQAWAIDLKVRGFNEAQIVYLLGMASPTHPVDAKAYTEGWLRDGYRSFRGRNGIFIPAGPRSGGPMFFAHYSYQGFDPRYWRDEVTNYFVRNQIHVDYQVAYAEENPGGFLGYAADSWGLTASDDPLVGYLAHEADESRDNGTITPTAALASMPYRPEAALAALRHFYLERGAQLLGPLGFYDAYNPTLGWTASSTLAIDQGPIVNMIENHRSGVLWKAFMANPEIAPALLAASWERDSTSVISGVGGPVLAKADLHIVPNPSAGDIRVSWPAAFDTNYEAELSVYTLTGLLAFRQNLTTASKSSISELSLGHLAPGFYVLAFRQNQHLHTSRLSLMTHNP